MIDYLDYLRNWEQQFGDADTGEYGYWRHGEHFPYQVHKLTPAEFQHHTTKLAEANAAFDEAERAKDEAAMEQALAESFPHELELLI